ncbi:hypothetical protein R3P38DRAFT_2666405, partial [Favolaschia claudopus]
MSVLPAFCNIVVSAIFDHCAAASCASLDFVVNHGLPTRSSEVSGVLSIPSTTGVAAVQMVNVSVVSGLPVDLVLGLDWLHLVHASSPDAVVHLSSGPLNVQQCVSIATHGYAQDNVAPLAT